MTALFLFVGVYITASIMQSIIRKISKPRKRKAATPKQTPAAMVELKPLATIQESTTPENNAILNTLTESRNTIIDSISEIDYLLDNAAQGREKLIDRRLKLLDKLAAVEIKINKYK